MDATTRSSAECEAARADVKRCGARNKAGLKGLNEHYTQFRDEIERVGLIGYAHEPPRECREGTDRKAGSTADKRPSPTTHRIGLGARHRGKPIVLFVADRQVRIVDADGELLRELTLVPTRDYQRQSA